MNKRIVILSSILGVLVLGIIIMLIANNGPKFNKPLFEENAIKVSDKSEYENKVIQVKDGYAFYIEGNPKLENGNLYINFYSGTDNDIYLKVRIFDNDELIAETGLLKTGELLEKVKVNKNNLSNNLTYLIMSYEKDTYYSMGEIKLNFSVGDSNE